MDTAVLLFEARAGRLSTPDGAWQFAAKMPRPPLDRWIGKLWELDGGCPSARERELPRGDLSFGVAPRELANSIVDLDALHGAAARTLVDAVRNAPTADRRLTLLGTYIAERAARACKWNAAVEWALERIAATSGCVPVSSLAREIGWSREHLHRRFVNQVGLGPKTCGQLARFHATLLALEYHSDDGLAAAAQRLGYCDQAHLAREFRAIAGTTITDYRRGRQFGADYGFARERTSHSSKS